MLAKTTTIIMWLLLSASFCLVDAQEQPPTHITCPYCGAVNTLSPSHPLTLEQDRLYLICPQCHRRYDLPYRPTHPSTSQDTPEANSEKINQGALSLNAGIDFTTHYFFRGIFQENQGLIAQPYAQLGANLYQGEGLLSKIDLTIGTWNSLHGSNPTGTGGPTQDPRAWYESDFYTGLSLEFSQLIQWECTYFIYTSPNGVFSNVQELTFKLSLHDQELTKAPFGLHPYVLLGVELDGAADGRDEGVYLELGLEPSYQVSLGYHMLTISLPLKIGLSLDDYYQDLESRDDDTFGYFDAGLVLALDLPCIPARWGRWQISARVDFLLLDGNTEELNQPTANNDFAIIGTVGLSMNY